ncbi:hypothetical protein BDW60DRAFT_153567 [Aspergillus nidulans var. acristatus]
MRDEDEELALLRDRPNHAFLTSTPWIRGRRLADSSGSSISPVFHSPLCRISAFTLRVKWHPANVLQAGFVSAYEYQPVFIFILMSMFPESESHIPCAVPVNQSLLFPCSQKINFSPGFNNFHTSFMTFFGSLTAQRTWMQSTASRPPSLIPSSLKTSLSSTPQRISLYLSDKPCFRNLASMSSKWLFDSTP